MTRIRSFHAASLAVSIFLSTVAAAGTVPGSALNQFSLDEYNGYFRVATSRFAMLAGASTRSDDVYVLDQGRMLAHGPPSEIRENLDVSAAYLGSNPIEGDNGRG